MSKLEKALRRFLAEQLIAEAETQNSFKESEEVQNVCNGAIHAYKEVILWLTERGEN
jgi:hypothetical protein